MYHVPPFDPCALLACQPLAGNPTLAALDALFSLLLSIGVTLALIGTVVLILRPLFLYLLAEENPDDRPDSPL